MALGSLLLTGEQIRAGRALLRLEQVELAKAAQVSLETIKRLEGMRGPVEANTRTVIAVAEAFEALGVVFDLGFGQGPGLRLVRSMTDTRQSANGHASHGQAGGDAAAK